MSHDIVEFATFHAGRIRSKPRLANDGLPVGSNILDFVGKQPVRHYPETASAFVNRLLDTTAESQTRPTGP